MSHGAPDYFGTNSQSFMHRVADLAELAARLGSSVTFDRRGNVLYVDSFDSGLSGWEETHTAGTGWVGPIAEPTHFGGVAIGAEYTPVADAYGLIYRYVALPSMTRYGFEVAFQPALNNRYLEQLFYHYDGVRVHFYGFRWYQQTGELKVMNAAGAWQTVTTIAPLIFFGYPWYIVKLVVDLDTGKYVRGMLNAITYDLSAYSALAVASDTTPVLYLSLKTVNDVADSTMAAWDDVIVTMGE